MVGIKLCRHCGSKDIQYEFHTHRGKREIYRCFECGCETSFRVSAKTPEEIQDELNIINYSVWGREDPQ